MFKKICTILLAISLSGKVMAADQILAQYQVTNLNVNEQVPSILIGIENFSASKVIITYAGALFYLANDVRVSIIEKDNNIPVELEGINPQYNYTNGSVIVSLVNSSDTSQNTNQDSQSHGDFFKYTTSESGFFQY